MIPEFHSPRSSDPVGLASEKGAGGSGMAECAQRRIVASQGMESSTAKPRLELSWRITARGLRTAPLGSQFLITIFG